MPNEVMGYCEYCGREVRNAPGGNCRQVTGWEELRGQGGANKITDRKETGKVAHFVCIKERQAGLDLQTSLW